MPEIEQNTPNYYPKTIEAIKMIQAGIDPAQALKYSNFKDNVSESAVAKIKQKARKYSLLHPTLVKSARTQVKRILGGETREIHQQSVTKAGQVVDYIETIAPSDSNILAAASMVYDRFEPVKSQQTEANQVITHIDFSVINNTICSGQASYQQAIEEKT